VGGKFTSINGEGVTGFAVLDPVTGQPVGVQPTLRNGLTPGAVRVETISVSGDSIYLGGAFTHTTGPNGSSRYTRNASRIDAASMMPNVNWRPEFNGTVLDSDINDDGTMAYFAGFFGRLGTDDAQNAAALPIEVTPAQL